MSTAAGRDLIREFIKKNLAKKQEHLEITDRDNIIANGIIDSLGIIKMIHFLEDRFSVSLRDEDITPDNFESIESISAFLERTSNSTSERNPKP
jgi:acyl carrier protein